mmetsp:Transcript_31647/g.46157  ORF Transcript_31647/g.46157 Transcript_31647/m.46157 type:complete len:232 (-) Transcript_31647:230-925(-)
MHASSIEQCVYFVLVCANFQKRHTKRTQESMCALLGVCLTFKRYDRRTHRGSRKTLLLLLHGIAILCQESSKCCSSKRHCNERMIVVVEWCHHWMLLRLNFRRYSISIIVAVVTCSVASNHLCLHIFFCCRRISQGRDSLSVNIETIRICNGCSKSFNKHFLHLFGKKGKRVAQFFFKYRIHRRRAWQRRSGKIIHSIKIIHKKISSKVFIDEGVDGRMEVEGLRWVCSIR